MQRDNIYIGIIAGIAGAIVQSTVTYVLYILGFTKVHYVQLAGELFLDTEVSNSALGIIVGLFADLTFGASWGILLVLLYPYLKMINAWLLKSIGFGFSSLAC